MSTSPAPAAALPTARASARASAAPAVELRGLVKEFRSPSGSVRAVDGLDLRIERGEVVAFLGPNGAGKTTTIDMVLGLAAPTSGTVAVLGGTPEAAVAAGRVAAVMQTGGLLRDLTVGETVGLTGALFGRDVDPAAYLARAGIADLADRLVAKCSGGQQQRLRFAMALVPDPDLLVLDEPTTGMDVEGRREFWAAIRADAAGGRTVVFATHYLDEADAYADRVVMVSHGRVVADGTAAEVKALASGRVVSAEIDDDATRAHAVGALRRLGAVESVEERGVRLIVHTADSDAVARHLLTATPARDVEITSRNLEDAFVALTTEASAR
ncbi:ABC transporter ATP-binding protein [Xylanimonas allomyrinae]|uniref:ABC transporter ATP-binding protein n=1 Tax=Xylanimonas allomyrinae TaxID=2509459 RepID=A0A4P6EKT6_9MICO|nr:ABC transporter ATP-binding protein [Xylanimonas allomyrinae]QAY63025.1 ABC transporter ATP-binding protein [Xylanimonas allomyrinae]